MPPQQPAQQQQVQQQQQPAQQMLPQPVQGQGQMLPGTPPFAAVLGQQSPMADFQNQLQQGPKTQNTYTAVRQMVDQMSSQIQSADMDEEKHKAWCDNEISKNQAVLDDKSTKLQRLSTKIDNEKEMVSELDQDLQLLEHEAQSVETHMQGIGRLRMNGHNAYVKSSQNRQMAQQILSQATMIL